MFKTPHKNKKKKEKYTGGTEMSSRSRSRSPRQTDCSVDQPHKDDALKLKKLQKKRETLSLEIANLVLMIEKMKKTGDEEFTLSQDCGVSSVTESYHEVPMPSLGTISTYSGPMSANWALMPGEVAEAFCFDR